MSNDPLHDKLDEIHRDMREGHAALHTRHDNHDQQIGAVDGRLTRIKNMLVAALKGDGEEFMRLWRG